MIIQAKSRRVRAGIRSDFSRAFDHAFTLVEVMVSTALLTFALIGLCSAFSFGFATIKVCQEDVRADQILVQKLETMRLYDWSKLTNGFLPANITVPFSDDGGVDYSVTISVEPALVPQTYSNTLRQVTVALSWPTGRTTRTRTMTTLVSQNGLQTFKP